MDSTDYPSLGMIAILHAQLAANRARVAAIVETQLDGVERLFRAATTRDWEAIERVSAELASQRGQATNPALARSAARVCESLREDPSGLKAGRRLAALLSACRSAKSRVDSA